MRWIILFLLMVTTVQAEERWESVDAICNTSGESIHKFYRDEGLVPLVAESGYAPSNGDMTTPVVHYLMYNGEDGIAIIRYYHDRACLLGVLNDLDWDPKTLTEKLGLPYDETN